MSATGTTVQNPLRKAILAQAISCGVIAVIASLLPGVLQFPLGLAMLEGCLVAVLSWRLGLPRWWWWIGLCFVPLAMVAQSLAIPSWLWLLAFVLVALVFWRTDASRVPLYMSNSRTAASLVSTVNGPDMRVIDLGCGDGSLLRHLARALPGCQFVGYEHAPLTWLWARVWSTGLRNLDIRYGSFWAHDLGEYDLVYAFLSPAPMTRLWEKAQKEMGVGSRMVSNSFAVPDVQPTEVVEVDDRRQTSLFIYRL